MKITIETKSSKEVELPKYFKNKYNAFFMLIDSESYMKVYNVDFVSSMALRPYIKIDGINVIQYDTIDEIEHISEAEFKHAYIKTSLAIEETLNN